MSSDLGRKEKPLLSYEALFKYKCNMQNMHIPPYDMTLMESFEGDHCAAVLQSFTGIEWESSLEKANTQTCVLAAERISLGLPLSLRISSGEYLQGGYRQTYCRYQNNTVDFTLEDNESHHTEPEAARVLEKGNHMLQIKHYVYCDEL